MLNERPSYSSDTRRNTCDQIEKSPRVTLDQVAHDSSRYAEPRIHRALIMVHGTNRNADRYFFNIELASFASAAISFLSTASTATERSEIPSVRRFSKFFDPLTSATRLGSYEILSALASTRAWDEPC